MKIKSIIIQNEGFVHCKSNFYSSHDILNYDTCYEFKLGVNKIIGEIDSGNWAISYLLSMYTHQPNDFVLFREPILTLNDKKVSINEISNISCYMDKIYPLFSDTRSVKSIIVQGLQHNQLNYTYEDIRNLFCIDCERFNKPLTGLGNEIFKAMAAIGFSYKKELFCFPWLSSKRFANYYENLTVVLKVLESLQKIVIMPTGKSL